MGAFLQIDSSDLAPVAVTAGSFSSFSETTTTGSSTGVSDTCGAEDSTGGFTCGLHIRPQCVAMTGYCDTRDTGRVPWVCRSISISPVFLYPSIFLASKALN